MIENLFTNAEAYLQIVAYIVAAAAAIAALTNNETDNVWVAWVQKAVNFLALNIGKAKNEQKPK